MKEENIDPVTGIVGIRFRAPRPEHFQDKLGSATKGAGIYTSLGGEARTTISHAEGKR
jgi:hypothetical protein